MAPVGFRFVEFLLGRELQVEQRKWIDYREYRAKAAAVFDGGAQEGKEKQNPEYWNSAGAITEVRTEIINALVNTDKFADREWQGTWIDGKGGTIRITENEDGSILFLAECVRGPTYHTGSIDGTARVNGRTARFSIKEDVAEKETWLTFLKREKKLELVSENAQYYCGARAYFDGEYVRVANLNPEELQKELKDR